MGRHAGYHHPRETRIRMGASALGIDPCDYARQIDAGNSWCSDHQAWEPVSTFAPRHDRVSGLNGRCREAARLRMREYRRRRRTP